MNASTPYDFTGRNLTSYGGLLPVVTMLEKLGFQSLVERTVTSKRIRNAALQILTVMRITRIG
jgi:hypothetical protein